MAAKRNNFLTKIMMPGVGELPDCHICVMGLLSVIMTMRLPAHASPHVYTAAIMAKNSLQLMSTCFHEWGQGACIHSLL